jgi:hypothetical protein
MGKLQYVTTASPPSPLSLCLSCCLYPDLVYTLHKPAFFYMQKKEHAELWFADILFLKRALGPSHFPN